MKTMVLLFLRVTQAIFSLVTTICASAAFPVRSSGRFFLQLSSRSFSFLVLTSFSSLLIAAGWAIVIGVFKFPSKNFTMQSIVIDLVFVTCFLLAGILTTVSNYAQECASYGENLRCGYLSASIYFCFSTILWYITSAVFNYATLRRDREKEHELEVYGEANTPTGNETLVQVETPVNFKIPPTSFSK